MRYDVISSRGISYVAHPEQYSLHLCDNWSLFFPYLGCEIDRLSAIQTQRGGQYTLIFVKICVRDVRPVFENQIRTIMQC